MIHAALDTSLGSALVVADGDRVLCNDHLAGTGRESDRELAPWVKATLDGLNLPLDDVRRWTVGTGPGSFAGLRYGIALVKGFCAISGAAMRGVPSCLALAHAALAEARGSAQRIGVLHDARCGQVILVRFERHADATLQLMGDALVLTPEELLAEQHRCDHYVSAQTAALPALPELVATRLLSCASIDAGALLHAPERLWPWPQNPQEIMASCEPLYVRPPVFVKPQPVKIPQI
ncbi:MAG: tRNA (adenosine(37)-N6)-threonylcarbamoyltransferase complex dimerization subunit type 1 TsaB [Lentisphaeria bacterium]|nr:tRNA (adenosine(37)-N6)-threonylcarbamoyltransferase complex dimerization subunit type 1 TsaB [Lentisphaeria bacterium]